mmetsp:Transcript_81049/g.227281  ORF Transcript_81049/g.227281 Transcript_81049/m.227281 type:complete len:99 (-) Transcript_81049:16-312(-)
MALSVLSSVPLVADMMQLIHMLWNEMGSEIILLLFFCTGFALFRLSSVRRFLPAGRLERAGHHRAVSGRRRKRRSPAAGGSPASSRENRGVQAVTECG